MKWYKDNKDKKRAYDIARRASNPEIYRAANRRYEKRYPGRKNAKVQERRAALSNRTPAWADSRAIREVYEEAARLTRALGVKMVVDHVIPLRGRGVSGLHVANNLRIIPESENLTKANRFSI